MILLTSEETSKQISATHKLKWCRTIGDIVGKEKRNF